MQFERDGFIGIFENAIEKDYCDSLIEYFNLKGNRFINPTQGLKHDNDMTEMFLDDPRTLYDIHPSYVDHFFEVLWKKIFPVYLNEFSTLANMHMQGHGLKMKKIKPGGGFHNWHYESIGERSPRKVVVQLYLNDIEEAGETEFLYQNKRISPKQSRMLLWPADWTHAHRGNPPIGKEVKYILTTWLEEVVKGY